MIELVEAREAKDAPDVIEVKNIKGVTVDDSDGENCYVGAEGELALKKGDHSLWRFRYAADPIRKPQDAWLVLVWNYLGDRAKQYSFDIKKKAWVTTRDYRRSPVYYSEGLLYNEEYLARGTMTVDKRGRIRMRHRNTEGNHVIFGGNLLDPTTWTIDYVQVDYDSEIDPDEIDQDDSGLQREVKSTWGAKGKYEWVSKVGPYKSIG